MVINKSLESGKIKVGACNPRNDLKRFLFQMALEDRLTIASAKLKRNNLILTENQLNMLRRRTYNRP
jgi:hypothetical protein